MPVTDPLHETVHAGRVLAMLQQRIKAAGGWLPFDAYMRHALYEPGLGYYSAGARKIGAGGDFTTAPEITPLFGRCIARHCAEVLAGVGGGEILELGAGSGRLACDVLTTLAERDALPTRYRILEVSADLRERQRVRIAGLPAPLAALVEWIDTPAREPWRGALIANEVLDALPVQCFQWQDGKLVERGVALGPANWPEWKDRPASDALREEVARLRVDAGVAWPRGFASELCAQVGAWIGEVTRSMEQGVALFVDYGLPRREYYHPHRKSGTLRCHYRQRAHDDPFAHPGMEDITAWVDFTRVAEAAEAAGLEVMGYTTQAALLLGLGIEAEVAAAPDEAIRIRRASVVRRLLMPEEMGETFKAIALGRGCDVLLSGFDVQDLRRML
jgi:SAM-dependent MidA family methyltransferase